MNKRKMIKAKSKKQKVKILSPSGTISYIYYLLFTFYFIFCVCSCTELDTRSSNDYIGPKKQEPAGLANQQTGEKKGTINESSIDKVEPNGPLSITITQAVMLSLENNKSLSIQKLNPEIKRMSEQQGLAAFDPVLTGRIANNQRRVTTGPIPLATRANSGEVGVEQFLPTGTDISLTGTTNIDETNDELGYASGVEFGLTQSLLSGAGTKVNLISVRQARLDTEISQYELRGYTESLVAQVENAYWDYILSARKIEIYTRSLELAQTQLEQTQQRISIGELAQSELAAAQATAALSSEDLINARSSLAKLKLTLLRLLNPPVGNIWDVNLVLQSQPVVPSVEIDAIEPHIALALRMRPDLNQAKLLWQRRQLDVQKTKNGLLPRLDLFISLGKTGYADSFGNSFTNLDDDNYQTSIGLNFSYPPNNRAAQGRYSSAVVTSRQAKEAINNLAQSVEVDVRNAYLEIVRTQQQMTATAATRRAQEEKFQSESEKFRVGMSTSLLVSQSQRDLVSARISEVQAQVGYIKAFVQMYIVEGSLLERRGLDCPGSEPVTLPDDKAD
jgi:outer membrane protein